MGVRHDDQPIIHHVHAVEGGRLPPSLRLRPVELASWLDARLHECVGFAVDGARLYGLEIVDVLAVADPGSAAARVSALGAGEDVTALVFGSTGHLACAFDAAALLVTGWSLLLDGRPPRPGRHLPRRRVRTVVVVTDDGTATAQRSEHDPDNVVAAAGLAAGGAAGLLLAAVWSGQRGARRS